MKGLLTISKYMMTKSGVSVETKVYVQVDGHGQAIVQLINDLEETGWKVKE